jgi:phosphoribosyl 1,2-cyclic phosphodiesterase
VITFSLQSGSDGNSIYVEAGGFGLLFDAGIAGKTAELLLREKDRAIRACDAIFISHDHADHVRHAGAWARLFGIPLYITPTTLVHSWGIGRVPDIRFFHAGSSVDIGPVRVHTIPTPHDAADGVAFVVEHDERRLGILTDLGNPFPELVKLLPDLDAAYLESNYDQGLLEAGTYPPHLKARIRGGRGHLSNEESATLVRDGRGPRLQWISVAHLSEENNRPQLALDAQRAVVGRTFPLHVAPRMGPGPLLEV